MTGKLSTSPLETPEAITPILKTIQVLNASANTDEIIAALRDNILSDVDHIGIHYHAGHAAAPVPETVRVWDRDNFALKAGLPDSIRRLVASEPLVVDNTVALDELLAPVKLYADDTLHAASLAVIPLWGLDGPKGYLVVASRQPRTHTDQQVRTLMALGGHIGVIIDKLTLTSSLQTNKDRTNALIGLAAALLKAPDMQSLEEALVTGVEQILPISHLSIITISPDQPEAGVMTLHGPPLPEQLPLAGTRVASALEDNKTLLPMVSNQDDEGDPWQSRGAEQLIVIPLLGEDRNRDVLVFGFEKTTPLSDVEIDLCNQVGALVAAGTNHIRQIGPLHAALEETTLLYSISLAINAAQNLDEVYTTALSEIARVTGADRIILQLAGPDPRESVEYVETSAIWHEDKLQTAVKDLRYPIATAPVISQFPQTRSNLIFNDVQTDPRIDKDQRIDYAKAGVNALMVLPLSTGAVWLGAILLETRQKQEFSNDQGRLARSLADQTSLAINAHLLLQRTRQGIARERALREISERVRQAQSVDEVMLLATSELSRVLEIPADRLDIMNTSDSVRAKLSRSEQEFIQNVSTQVGLAIQNIKLLDDTRQAVLREQTIRDLAAALNSTLDLDEVLDLILTNVGRVLPHDAANIQFLDGDIVHIVAGRGYEKYGFSMKDMLGVRFSLANLPNYQRMMESKTPFVVSDTETFESWIPVEQTAWAKSYIGAPIYVENEIIGFLNLDSATPGSYSEETYAGLLQAFANQAASAIRNARIYGITSRQAKLMSAVAVQLERATGLDDLMAATVHTLSTSLGEFDVKLRLGTPTVGRQLSEHTDAQDDKLEAGG